MTLSVTLLCRRHYISHGPIRPILDAFPKTNKRSFRHQWYEKYSWLEYSVDKDAAFCFVCRNFSLVKGSQSSSTFTTTGFNDWSKALARNRGFDKHSMSLDHKGADNAYCEFLSAKPIIAQLSQEAERQQTQREVQIRKNRSVIGRLFDIIRVIGKLGMPLRGHREDESSDNKGLFRELVEFLASSGDEILSDHLQNMAANATYLSATIQNEMIEIIGESILDAIRENVGTAGIFSVLMDETTDASHTEQVSIMVRFVDKNATDEANIVNERLIGIVSATQTTGEALTELLLTVLDNNSLNVQDIVGQGYDGGSNMSGGAKGVQARIKSLNPRAMYTHCFAHCLNRALVNAICSREHAAARNFFGIVELAYTFVEGSAARHHQFITAQERLLVGTNDSALHLKGLSETRWNCRSESLTRLAKTEVYQAVIETIDYVINTTSDGSVRGVAAGLRHSLTDFQFIVQLFALRPVLAAINETSIILQNPHLDLLNANRHITNLSSVLSTLRADTTWEEALSCAQVLADKLGIDAAFPETRKRKVPNRLLHKISASTDANDMTSDTVPVASLKMRAEYFALLDRLTHEIRDRFPDKLKMFSPLQRANMDMLDATIHLAQLAETYGIEEERLVAQWQLFRQSCGRQRDVSIASTFLVVPREHEALRMAYQVLLTLPVTSAGVERSFSRLSFIKSKLRTTMTQPRLQALMLCAVEKDVLRGLSSDILVAKFASKADRRMDLG